MVRRGRGSRSLRRLAARGTRRIRTATLALCSVLIAVVGSGCRGAEDHVLAARQLIDAAERDLAAPQANVGMIVRRWATDAARLDSAAMPPDLRRRATLLKLRLTSPPPADSVRAAEMATLGVGMVADYDKGTYCRSGPSLTGEQCLDVNGITRIIAESRDPSELLEVWKGWQRVGAPLHDGYARFVALANEGAVTLGFSDVGVMWRSAYEMPPEELSREADRLWEQVKPLYASLHAFVRRRLAEGYGTSLVSLSGPIPAHLLGNIWAEDWSTIYPVVAPPQSRPLVDLTQRLRARDVDAKGMARYGERFFLSLGFDSLPPAMGTTSLVAEPTAEQFIDVYQALGHEYYRRAYAAQPFLYQGGANDAFPEAISGAIALSLTPAYLKEVGIIPSVPPPATDTVLLLRTALEKVAFLPFALMADQWRWQVFAGDIAPADYNRRWWELRTEYGGVAPPGGTREPNAFDPGAQYNIPANVPYMRYFLATILQFQFYRALCQAAGHVGPLNRCSFYGSAEAGRKLAAVLSLGASKPWPEALFELTGQREMDAAALLEYFAPLKVWLDRQNAGKTVGW